MSRGFLGTCLSVALVSLAGCAENEDLVPAAPPAPPVVESVSYSYTTNVYVGSTPIARAPVTAATAEVDPCQALFAKSSACVRSLTTDTSALEHFDRRIEISRREDAVVAAGDTNASRELQQRCAVALRAYDTAPCGG